MSVSVCVCVCPRAYLRNPILGASLGGVATHTLCASGLIDDVILAHNGPYEGMSIPLQRVTSLRRRAQGRPNVPAVSYWLDRVLDVIGCRDASVELVFIRPSARHVTVPQPLPSCYSAPDRIAEYCDERVCVCVRDHIFGTTRPIFANFYACYLWPWLDPHLAA